jgi:hypothetical protein
MTPTDAIDRDEILNIDTVISGCRASPPRDSAVTRANFLQLTN